VIANPVFKVNIAHRNALRVCLVKLACKVVCVETTHTVIAFQVLVHVWTVSTVSTARKNVHLVSTVTNVSTNASVMSTIVLSVVKSKELAIANLVSSENIVQRNAPTTCGVKVATKSVIHVVMPTVHVTNETGTAHALLVSQVQNVTTIARATTSAVPVWKNVIVLQVRFVTMWTVLVTRWMITH